MQIALKLLIRAAFYLLAAYGALYLADWETFVHDVCGVQHTRKGAFDAQAQDESRR